MGRNPAMKLQRLLLSICLIALLIPLPTQGAVSETDGGIFYSVTDGIVTVEGFNAAGTVMDIPATIDGMPVRYIADQTCRGDGVITEVRIPASIVSVGEFAFADCPNLTKVTCKGGETIGYSAFRGCEALLSLTLPETLTTIDDSAFYGCTMLGTVKIPSSVTAIGTDAFMGCDRLILNVKDNAYAKAYAEQYHIPTGFTSTFSFTLILLALTTVILGAALWVGYRLIMKRRHKN